MNKKLLILAGAGAGIAVVAKRAASRAGIDFAQMIERMPDDAPPKWMFLNISAIRENTERILQLLEAQPPGR